MSFSKKTAGLVILMVCSGIILYYLLRKKETKPVPPTEKPRYEIMPVSTEEMCYTTFIIPEKEVY